MLLGDIAHVRSVPGMWDAVPTWQVLFGIWAIKDTQKWNPLSPSKFLSVVTDANDLPVTDSESDGDSAVEEWRCLHPDLESLCCELRFIL